ncbi:nuclear pore complex subunit [Malassezia vespertilionis]|uniref:Nuclear pore protein n=1 Tax=Malassezia vespertilionis TaxID=2020962 RepID=A0A2N1JGK5_9BASI|nr:nuclear pore complex subunit [Malassezia vespertilionis]PKI85687.1 hypothetical protein MVES_000642 [Malassezia vespertilionis]WFD05358.1 nuclear pore complex subunit [Malassezia vespertilionis]
MDAYLAQAAPNGQPVMSLSDILQQSRKLTNQIGRDSDLPPIQLGIDQIESQSRKLASKSVRNGNSSAEARAHYLLASGGIDAAQLANSIQHTNIANTFEPLQPVYDTDIEGYVRHEHEQIILSMIEESRQQTLDDFQQGLGKNLAHDWQVQKKRISEELGQHRVEQGSVSFAQSVSSKDALRESVASNDSPAYTSLLHSRMIRYDTVVVRLNRARVENEPIPLIHAFMETAESFTQEPTRKRGILDTWTILKYMVHESGTDMGTGLPKPVKEREYAASYLDLDAFHSESGSAMRQKWVQSACAYLEAQFAEHMEQVIAANPLKAQRGGVPTVRATVSAFLRVLLKTPQGAWGGGVDREMDLGTETPLWAQLFYLLRIGKKSEAFMCAQENEATLSHVDPSFLTFFKAWLDAPNRQLARTMRDPCMAEYVSRFRSVPLEAQDPYHYALYRLMGRFDVAKKFPAALVSSTENWLWLQLSMVTESASKVEAQDSTLRPCSLQDLANKLEKYGEAYFDPKGNRPLHYFQLLLLVGQFERAVGFLHTRLAFQVDVVQFAIALTYYGLLRVPSLANTSQFDLVTIAETNHGLVTYLDFSKLIQRYTRAFSQSSARDALEYISLLCLNADAPPPIGEAQVARCHELVRSLLLEATSTGFVELLGDVRTDGAKVPGLIEQSHALLHLRDKRDFLNKIVQFAATQCEREQRFADAILLYNHVGEYDTVLSVLNRQLGATLMEPANVHEWQTNVDAGSPASLSAVSNIVTLARSILTSYEQQFGYQSAKSEVCHTLLGLKKAVSLYHDNQLQPALQAFEAQRVLPLDPEARKDVVSITRKAEDFKNYDENLTKNFSEIVLMAMTILYKLHQELKNSLTRTGSGTLYEYRSQARALMMWAGMLRFRMSNETYSQLTRLDVYVH